MLCALLRRATRVSGMQVIRQPRSLGAQPVRPATARKNSFIRQQLATSGRHASTMCSSAAGEAAATTTTATKAPSSSTAVTEQKPSIDKSRYCRMCGSPMHIAQPAGDQSWRHVCSGCGYVDYFNPKLVVGCIVEHQGKILLCKRAIQPCQGLWTVPAGFLEIGESCAAGAVRETWEEAAAHVEVLAPYTHLDIPVIGQSYVLFRARLAPPYTFSSGAESLDVQLFDPSDIPFDQLAFSSVAITLRQYLSDMQTGTWHIHHGVIVKVPGSAPNDPAAFSLEDHYAIPIAAAT